METEIIQQEILLFTTTSFSQRELCEKLDYKDSESWHSTKEKLQEACWNGLLPDMLPEIINNKKLFIWQIQEGKTFLCIDRSGQPANTESIFSINPYRFLAEVNYN